MSSNTRRKTKKVNYKDEDVDLLNSSLDQSDDSFDEDLLKELLAKSAKKNAKKRILKENSSEENIPVKAKTKLSKKQKLDNSWDIKDLKESQNNKSKEIKRYESKKLGERAIDESNETLELESNISIGNNELGNKSKEVKRYEATKLGERAKIGDFIGEPNETLELESNISNGNNKLSSKSKEIRKYEATKLCERAKIGALENTNRELMLFNQNMSEEDNVLDINYAKLNNYMNEEQLSNPLVQMIIQISNQQKQIMQQQNKPASSSSIRNLNQKIPLYLNSKLYTTVYRLELAKKSKSVEQFVSRIFTSLFNVVDLYRTNITGSGSKKKEYKTQDKKPLNKDVKVELYRAVEENVKKLIIDNEKYKQQVDSKIASKISSINRLFEAMKQNDSKANDLVKKVQGVNEDDLIDFNDFQQYDNDRSLFFELDKFFDQ